MGAITPSKMPCGSKKPRRDNTEFTQYAKGGGTPSMPAKNRAKTRKEVK